MTPLWKSRLPQKIGAQRPTMGIFVPRNPSKHHRRRPQVVTLIRIKLSTAISTIELHSCVMPSIQPLTLIQRISILFWQYAGYIHFGSLCPTQCKGIPVALVRTARWWKVCKSPTDLRQLPHITELNVITSGPGHEMNGYRGQLNTAIIIWECVWHMLAASLLTKSLEMQCMISNSMFCCISKTTINNTPSVYSNSWFLPNCPLQNPAELCFLFRFSCKPIWFSPAIPSTWIFSVSFR